MSEETMPESKEQSLLEELAHSETVRKLIECPVCLELPLPPIYVCNKGHIVCNNCQARTYACPLCREHYSTTRGFVAEGIIEKCVLRCKFADHGCPLSMKGSALVDHLEACDYRPVKCVDCGGKLVNFDEYEEHLLKFHRINGINQSRAYVIYSMNLAHQIAFGEKCCWPQYYLKAFDNVTFLLRLYATHWFVCAWISLLGPKGDCAKYEAMLEFHPTNDDSVVHTWQGPVNHFRDDPAKQIFLQGRGLITPMETLMQIAPVANDHAEWLYNIEILQASEKSDSDEGIENENEEGAQDNLEASLEAGAEEKTTDIPLPESQQVEKKSNDPIAAGAAAAAVATAAAPELDTNSLQGSCASASPQTPPQPISQQTARGSKSELKFNNRGAGDRVHSSFRLMSSDTPRVVAAPSCPPLRTPRRPTSTSTASTGSRSSPNATIHSSHSGTNTNVLTPGPATNSPSTSALAQAATVTSVPPPQRSHLENSQGSPTFPWDSYNPEASSGPIRVSTLRPSARLLNNIRRTAAASTPFALFLRGESRTYGISEDDWNFSSESDGEE